MTYLSSGSPLRINLVFEVGLLAATPTFRQAPTLCTVFLEVGPHGLTSFTSEGSKMIPSSSDGFPKAKGCARPSVPPIRMESPCLEKGYILNQSTKDTDKDTV